MSVNTSNFYKSWIKKYLLNDLFSLLYFLKNNFTKASYKDFDFL